MICPTTDGSGRLAEFNFDCRRRGTLSPTAIQARERQLKSHDSPLTTTESARRLRSQAVWAIYVWCRRTDDIVDGPRAMVRGKKSMQQDLTDVSFTYTNSHPIRKPVSQALEADIRRSEAVSRVQYTRSGDTVPSRRMYLTSFFELSVFGMRPSSAQRAAET